MGCLITIVQKPWKSCKRKKSDRNHLRGNLQNTSQISSDSSILNSSIKNFDSNSISDFNKEVSTADLLSLDNHANNDVYILQDEYFWSDENQEDELMEKEVKDSRSSQLIEEKEKTPYVPMETDDEDEAQANNNPRYYLRSQKKHYPGLRDDLEECMTAYRLPLESNTSNDLRLNANVKFFRNEIKSKPNGGYLNDILEEYWGDYDLLERKHDYIQWIFPLRTQGLNSYSQILQLHELEELKNDEASVNLLLQSFKMMLDFYGMKLKTKDSHEIVRAKNYKQRYQNLINHRHNNLRIARILQCLGDFELNEYQYAFIKFLSEEVFREKELISCDDSLTRFWVHTIKDDTERNKAIKYIEDLISS